MNCINRLVWNQASNAWVTVSENSSGRGKSVLRRKIIVTALALAFSPLALAAPVGGQVSAGSGSINQAGATTTITQQSQNLAINWQSFGIAANETVHFNQPSASAIALNRVLGQNPSQILGNLNANGQVFILNPNGVLFGQGSQVNVGGLVASTLNLSDADFMAGKNGFSNGGNAGSVVNQGTLTAANGGYIALLAPNVRNEGVISATLGTALLAAGDKVTLNLNSGSLLSFSIDQGSLNALAENKQLIQADGGQVYMSAQAANSLTTAVVNNTGIIEARTLQNINGTIRLIGDMTVGTVNVGGTLDASAPTNPQSAISNPQSNGGFIETSAAHVHVANDAHITTAAANGLSGTWLIDPVDFTIAATGGDMTGAALTLALDPTTGGNVVIQSSLGAAGTAGDVNVNDAVTWSANKLTLNAQNNININANLNASGTASLALEYGQNTAAGNATNQIITNNGASVNLPAGTTNFTTKLGSNGAVKNYTVITDLGAAGSVTTTDLQGIKGNLAGNYVLGANIDASATSTWNLVSGTTYAGFAPIGKSYTQGTNFTGTFDGLGHTIGNIYINDPSSYVGLFGNARYGSVIRNVGLINANVSGGWGYMVGALVGGSYGTIISNSYATGNVTGHANYTGGLVGFNSGGTISNSYSAATVSGGYGNVGGLAGYNDGTIDSSHAAGIVSSTGYNVGGLVGHNYGTVSNSYVSSASVTGSQSVGGLMGNNSGTTSNSHYDIDAVTINGVTGIVASGGLYNTNGTGQFNEWLTNGLTLNIANYASLANVGVNSYTISSVQGMKDLLGFADNAAYTFTLANSITLTAGLYIPYLAGTFDGGSGSGFTISGLNLSQGSKIGLFGTAGGGSVIQNVALLGGSVSGGNYVGALVGYNSGTITNSSSTNGNVSSSAGYDVGGLVGRNSGSITNGFATGSVTAGAYSSNVGGLVGRNYGTIDHSYAAGSVAGSYGVGGLVGYSRYGTVSNSYVSSASVTGSQSVGGLTGGGTVTNSHYDIDAVTINGSSAVTLGGLYNTNGTGQFNDWLTNGSLNIANYTSLTNAGTNSYTIGSVQGMKDLLGFADNAGNTYTLTSNIDLASTPGLYIPVLAGTFDGAGHTISNLSLSLQNNNVGLFGTAATGSSILNVGLVGGSVNGNEYVGGLVGTNNGTISNSYATGVNVHGAGSNVGGLVGINSGLISNSYASSGSVSGNMRAGGLVGQNLSPGTISNSYATDSSDGYYSGGLVGLNYGSVSNSYATGSVTGQSAGGLIGYNNSINVTNNFWDTTTAGSGVTNGIGQNASYGGSNIGLTTLQALTQASYAGFDFTNTWYMVDGSTRPFLRMEYSTTITNAHQLQLIGLDPTANYTLANNLDLAAELANPSGMWGGGVGNGFAPIGTIASLFSGTFNGQGHTISNLEINRPLAGYVGLFAITTASALIENVGLIGGSVTGGNYNVGALVGQNDGTVSNCYATGSVTGSATGNSVGGLVGYNSGTISNSSFTGSVSGNNYVGGLVGNNNYGTINLNSYAAGSVSGSNYVGGLVGTNYGTVSNSNAASSVTGTGNAVGGLVGYNNGGTIDTSYATGNVNTTAGSNHGRGSGGLVGYNYGTINNSNATGNVGNGFGSDNAGLVGDNGGNINSSYAKGNVTGSSVTTGGLVGYNNSGTISDSNATGVVSGGNDVGGLVGILNSGTISNSYATGSVSGNYYVGGLVGYNSGTINSNSYATGSVSGNYYVGGLVGYNNYGTISASSATGSVSGSNYVGGLVGTNYGTINLNSYATGSVSGSNYVGGLVGRNFGTVDSSSAASSVSGSNYVGGLVGTNYGAVSNSYVSGGSVQGTQSIGGLVGRNYGTATNSYYDVDAVSLNGAHAVTLGGLYNTGGTGQFNDWLTGGLTLNIANYASLANIGTNSYTISSVQGMKDLLGFADNAAYTFTLTSSITLPAGLYVPLLAGTFDGAGFTLANLSINLPNNNLGLFGTAVAGSVIQNVVLTGGSVSGGNYVGALVGNNNGTISNSYAAGVVSGASYVGGLVGYNNGTINSNSYAANTVTGTGNKVGGLVGSNYGTVSNSYATGSVSGGNYVGGLVGGNYGTVNNSYVTGSVSGGNYVGGLVGVNGRGTVSNSYAAGAVTGTGSSVGGLVGWSNGAVSNSYAAGSVTSTGNNVGGLVGSNFGSISNTYATGSVSGTGSNVGGLVGFNNYNGTVSNSFWDTTTSGQATSSGGTGMSTADMMTQANFTSATATNGNVNPNWDLANTWVMYDGYTAPLLRSFMTALTVTANGGTKVYDGLVGNGVSYSTTPNANLLGTVSYGISQNVGSYTTSLSGLYSNQQGYIISYVNGALTVTPKVLTVTGLSGTNRTYNGSTVDALTGTAVLNGLVTGESLVLGGTTNGTLASANAGSQAVSTAILLANGTGGLASNYVLTQPALSNVTIAQAALTVTGLTGTSRTYNGSTVDALTGTAALNGLVTGESLTLGGTTNGTLASANAGSQAVSTAILLANGTGGLASNYVLTQPALSNVTITQAALTVTGLTGTSRTYNGSTVDALTGTAALNGLVAGESLVLGGTTNGTLASANAGSQAVSTAVTIANGTGLASNYVLTQPALTATIAQAGLSPVANAATQMANRLVFSGAPVSTTNPGSYVITPTGLYPNMYNISYSSNILTIVSSATPVGLTGGVYESWDGVWQSYLPRLLVGM